MKEKPEASKHQVPLAFMCAGESGTLEEIRGLRHHVDKGLGPDNNRPFKRYRRAHLFHHDKGHRLEHRLNYMGLVPGQRVKVMKNNAPGPVIVAVKDSRLCLGRGVASKLMINPDDGGPDSRGTCDTEAGNGGKQAG